LTHFLHIVTSSFSTFPHKATCQLHNAVAVHHTVRYHNGFDSGLIFSTSRNLEISPPNTSDLGLSMKGRPSPRKAIQTWLVQNERGDGGQGAVLPDDFAETGYDTSQRRHTSTVQRSRREITSHCDEGADTLTPLRKRFGTSGKRLIRRGIFLEKK